MRRLALVTLIVTLGCSPVQPRPTSGPAVIEGAVTGLALASPHALSIARHTPGASNLQLKLAALNLTCTLTEAADHLTFDLGAEKVGTYVIGKGYPTLTTVGQDQARGHACPGNSDPTSGPGCHDAVLSGSITITKIGGLEDPVEGTFVLKLIDGDVSGSFSAYRCD